MRRAAPMVTFLPDTLMPFSSLMRAMSTTSDGAASRIFIAGISVMPPDSALASPFFRSFAASATEDAR